MIFPVMKKEIHRRLIKRIFFSCLLASILAAAGVIFIEIKRVNHTLLDSAVKQAPVFSNAYAMYNATPADEQLTLLERSVSGALEHTTFVLVELFNSDRHR